MKTFNEFIDENKMMDAFVKKSKNSKFNDPLNLTEKNWIGKLNIFKQRTGDPKGQEYIQYIYSPQIKSKKFKTNVMGFNLDVAQAELKSVIKRAKEFEAKQ